MAIITALPWGKQWWQHRSHLQQLSYIILLILIMITLVFNEQWVAVENPSATTLLSLATHQEMHCLDLVSTVFLLRLVLSTKHATVFHFHTSMMNRWAGKVASLIGIKYYFHFVCVMSTWCMIVISRKNTTFLYCTLVEIYVINHHVLWLLSLPSLTMKEWWKERRKERND